MLLLLELLDDELEEEELLELEELDDEAPSSKES